ncbi:unnamed protein product [Closterium sp. Naga37s-1]|nr:unnamed protein product [Closterium sp. Naga37s-1]CAI5533628.1 unnamed protein product [Closterium sp. Naga37s-1]CAI5533634.1 unnamed protein product [Closterium sp. Naga37s-1]CAI5533636.1 unnamed protein product [Closterium sp. Naga37s-1]CAI5533638.1 unnamed protein product [Closterium sp. Naga37s-1]
MFPEKRDLSYFLPFGPAPSLSTLPSDAGFGGSREAGVTTGVAAGGVAGAGTSYGFSGAGPAGFNTDAANTAASRLYATGVASGETLADAIIDIRRELSLSDGNPRLAKGLAEFFDEILSEEESQEFFFFTLPGMASLALRLPSLVSQQARSVARAAQAAAQSGSSGGSGSGGSGSGSGSGGSEKWRRGTQMTLQLLRPQQPGLVLITQELAAALLVGAFFCVYPTAGRAQERLPEINFDRLYGGIYEGSPQQQEKLRCLLHYFRRVVSSMPQGAVSYERKVLPLTAVTPATVTPAAAAPPTLHPFNTPGTDTPGHLKQQQQQQQQDVLGWGGEAGEGGGRGSGTMRQGGGSSPPGSGGSGGQGGRHGSGNGGSKGSGPTTGSDPSLGGSWGKGGEGGGLRSGGSTRSFGGSWGTLPPPPGADFWGTRRIPLCALVVPMHHQVHERGTIEDDGTGCVQVDFANAFVGGGTLGSGCAQEEIRFVICPELIVGMLFLPAMENNETIEIVGPERFTRYTG